MKARNRRVQARAIEHRLAWPMTLLGLSLGWVVAHILEGIA